MDYFDYNNSCITLHLQILKYVVQIKKSGKIGFYIIDYTYTMNMKKVVVGTIMTVLAMSYCVTNAQKTDREEDTVAVTQDVMSSVSPAAMDDIYKIVLHYCNEEIQ